MGTPEAIIFISQEKYLKIALTVGVFSGDIDYAKIAERHENFDKRFVVSAYTGEAFVKLLSVELAQGRHHGHGHILHVAGQVRFQLIN